MERYFEASIVNCDDNGVPYVKYAVCMKTDITPDREDFELLFDGKFDKHRGDEIRNIHEITKEDAMMLYDDIEQW